MMNGGWMWGMRLGHVLSLILVALSSTRREVLVILLLELGLLAVLAQPPGWAIGYVLAWIMKTNLAGELMGVRLIAEPSTYM